MEEIFTMTFNKNDWVWKLNDGRYWSTAKTAFITEAEAQEWLENQQYGLMAIQPSPKDAQGHSSVEGLVENLHFYGLPLGELASPDELFAMLRQACETRLSQTDYAMTSDYPISDESKVALLAYRKAIRELNHQQGAPWDGGGSMTPWPEMPAISKTTTN